MRRTGSLTVFAALSLMLVAQLLFTLLEVARYRESAKVLQMRTDRGLESAFADYCSPLWETYRVLGMTVADGEGNFSFREREAAFCEESADTLVGVDLLTAVVEDVEFSDYVLLTDQGGRVFEETVCAYMKQNLGYEAVKAIYSKYESVKEATKNYDGGDDSLQDAQDALRQMRAGVNRTGSVEPTVVRVKKTKATESQVTASAPAEDGAENPITAVAQAKQKGVLALVLPESTQVSANTLSLSQTVSHRTLTQGTKSEAEQGDWYQTVLFNQYLETYLACYTDADETRGLSYELEYLIGGKASDEENLRMVIKELLVMREALNMTSLTASSERQTEALALATAIAGISANPAIIEAVKYGIMAAWAFVESVLDLRALLAGGSIALVKSDADWTSNVNEMPALLNGRSQAKSNAQGLNYREYLGLLLLFHSGNTLAMRAMDVEEATVRREERYASFQMDHVVCETQMVATYEYDPLFMGFVTLLQGGTDMLRMQRTTSYSYRNGKEGT